jgi:hypothetical protein
VIEKPLPLAPKKRDGDSSSEALLARESRAAYGESNGSDVLMRLKLLKSFIPDHVIGKAGPREKAPEYKTKRLVLRLACNRSFDLPASRRRPRAIPIEARVNVSC